MEVSVIIEIVVAFVKALFTKKDPQVQQLKSDIKENHDEAMQLQKAAPDTLAAAISELPDDK